MGYDFNIKEALEVYGNDPNALINAFNDALNAELESQNEPEDLTMVAASDVAGLWNEYIQFYVNQKHIEDMVNIDDFIISPQFLLDMTEFLVSFFPIMKNYFVKEEPAKD